MQAGFKLSGRYALQALLGSGGMGEVWRGVDERLDRPVAVKVLREHLVDPELAGRFRREARIAARLQHPGITVVHDVDSDNGRLFIVMELLHGRDLAAILAEAAVGMPIDAAVSLTLQATEALQAAHAGHVVHRDLKPANLFVLDGGQLKICDFGIARAIDAATHLTVTGQAIGTPAYMSPEQCLGQQVDERSDLYSLGCALYALLTGQPPFTEGQPLAIMSQHLNTTPTAPRTIRPDIPPELDHLVLELLAKDPAHRPADAGHVIAELRALRYTPTVKVEPTAKASSRLDLDLVEASRACAHFGAEQVVVGREVVEWLCPDCHQQLPPEWSPQWRQRETAGPVTNYERSRRGLLAEIALLQKRKAEILSDDHARYVDLRIQSLDAQIARRTEQLAGVDGGYAIVEGWTEPSP